MSSSVLFPPNLDNFSDDIIGTVILRSTPLSYTHSTPKIHNDASVPTTVTEDPQMQTTISPNSASFEAFSTMNTPSKRKRMQNSAPSKPTRRKKKRIVPIEVRRERRRVNMQRYRHNLRDREGTLEQKVQRLKEEIPELQLQRDTVQARGKESTTWNIAAEYFRLFRYGLKETLEGSNVTEGEPLALVRSQAQKGFLYAVLAPNVVGLSGVGVEKLLEDYRTLAFCLPNMSTRLVRLKKGAGGSIHATTKVKFVITENTLRLAFPHLITGGKVSPLAAKLLGQRFVMRGSVHFEWDSDIGRVSLLQAKADLLTPILEQLKDLEMVSSVFKDALITPECTPTCSDE